MMLQNERKAAPSSIAQVLDIDNGKSREVGLFCSVATKQTKGSLATDFPGKMLLQNKREATKQRQDTLRPQTCLWSYHFTSV